MSSSLLKIAVSTLLLAFAISQTPSNDTSANYLSQQCCPKGYNSAGVYCVKCIEPKHWDSLNQKCVTCQVGHTWDNITHQCTCCESPRQIINGQCICRPPTSIWKNDLNACLCPANSFGDNCTACPAPRVWSNNTCGCPAPTTLWNGNQCVCPTGKYGPNCVECPAPRHWDSVANQCICNTPFIWNDKDCICPTPYFLNQGRCAKCPDGFEWTNNQCKECQCTFKDLQVLKA